MVVSGCFTGYSKRSTGCLNGSESGEEVIRRSSSLHWPRHAFTSKTTPRFLEFGFAPCQSNEENQLRLEPLQMILILISKAVCSKLDCGPPYPMSCRCSWSVRVHIQVILQRNTCKSLIEEQQQNILKKISKLTRTLTLASPPLLISDFSL